MEVWFPALTFPALKIRKGILLDFWLLGFHVVIPPWDVTLWEEVEVWKSLKIFNSTWVTDPILTALRTYFPEQMRALEGIGSTLTHTAGNVSGILEGLGRDPLGTIHLLIRGLEDRVSARVGGWVDALLTWGNDTSRWLHAETGRMITRLQDSLDEIVVRPVMAGVNDLRERLPGMVWDHAKTKLDAWAADYYERHSED